MLNLASRSNNILFAKFFVDKNPTAEIALLIIGGTIVAKEAYTTDDKDFNAQLTKIKSASPDVVYLPAKQASHANLLHIPYQQPHDY